MEYTPAKEPDACIGLLDKWIINKKKELHRTFVLNAKDNEEGDTVYIEELKKVAKQLNSYIDKGDRDLIKDYDLPEEICKCILEVVGASVVYQDRITAWCIDYPAIRTTDHLIEEINDSNQSKI